MNIFHTSPSEIAKINKFGTFGDVLCLSSDIYMMSAASTFVYSMNVEESDIIEVAQLDDADTIADIANYFDVDAEQAESLLDGTLTAFDVDGDGEDDWYLQGKQGQAARNMGYLVAKGEDEQGAVYLFSASNRESKLTLN